MIDSDLTPDLYINAFAWGCDKPNGQGAPHPVRLQTWLCRSFYCSCLSVHTTLTVVGMQVFKHGVPTAGSGATGQSFGGQGSGFAPPRYLERAHNS